MILIGLSLLSLSPLVAGQPALLRQSVYVHLDLARMPKILNLPGVNEALPKQDQELAAHLTHRLVFWKFEAQPKGLPPPLPLLTIVLVTDGDLELSPMSANLVFDTAAQRGISWTPKPVPVYEPGEFKQPWRDYLSNPDAGVLVAQIVRKLCEACDHVRESYLEPNLKPNVPIAVGLVGQTGDEADLPLPWRECCAISASVFEVRYRSAAGDAHVVSLGIGEYPHAEWVRIKHQSFRKPPASPTESKYEEFAATVRNPQVREIMVREIQRGHLCPIDGRLEQ